MILMRLLIVLINLQKGKQLDPNLNNNNKNKIKIKIPIKWII